MSQNETTFQCYVFTMGAQNSPSHLYHCDGLIVDHFQHNFVYLDYNSELSPSQPFLDVTH